MTASLRAISWILTVEAETASRTCWNSRNSRSRIFSSAPRTFSSYSFSSGVMNRSALASVCFRMIVLRYIGQIRLRDLDIIPEDPVVAHLERADAGPLPLALLDGGDPPLAFGTDAAQLVQFRAVTLLDQLALPERIGRIVGDSAVDQLEHLAADRPNPRPCRRSAGHCRPTSSSLTRGSTANGLFERQQVPGIGHAERSPADQPLQVIDAFQCGRADLERS